MRFRLAGSVFSLLVAGSPALAGNSPTDIAAAFCEARLRNDEADTLVLFSQSLAKVVEEAQARNKLVADARPDEKPPFGDGIPYQSYQDQASACQAGDVTDGQNYTEIEVRYKFAEASNADWTDRLKLVKEPAGWQIDDILFVDVANGVPQQGLRRVLFEAFDQ